MEKSFILAPSWTKFQVPKRRNFQVWCWLDFKPVVLFLDHSISFLNNSHLLSPDAHGNIYWAPSSELIPSQTFPSNRTKSPFIPLGLIFPHCSIFLVFVELGKAPWLMALPSQGSQIIKSRCCHKIRPDLILTLQSSAVLGILSLSCPNAVFQGTDGFMTFFPPFTTPLTAGYYSCCWAGVKNCWSSERDQE